MKVSTFSEVMILCVQYLPLIGYFVYASKWALTHTQQQWWFTKTHSASPPYLVTLSLKITSNWVRLYGYVITITRSLLIISATFVRYFQYVKRVLNGSGQLHYKDILMGYATSSRTAFKYYSPWSNFTACHHTYIHTQSRHTKKGAPFSSEEVYFYRNVAYNLALIDNRSFNLRGHVSHPDDCPIIS
jgi:hypothetical protein